MKNKNKIILEEVNKTDSWRYYKKTKPLWAKQLKEEITVNTLEGNIKCQAGDYLCKGPSGDQWPQKEESLFKKYDSEPGSKPDKDGWQKFIPKPDAKGVMASQIAHEFSIEHSTWGTFHGNAGGYLVKNYTDKDNDYPEDIWIVNKEIFEATYELI